MSSSFNRRSLLRAGVPVAGSLAAGYAAGAFPSARAISPGLTVTADPKLFPGIDPTGATNSQVGMQRAFEATPENGKLLIPEGRYLIDGQLSNRGKAMNIEGYGATLVKAKDTLLMNIYLRWGPIFKVTSLIQTSVTSGGATRPTTEITISEAVNWEPGDAVKIFSDDLVEDSRASSSTKAPRMGQLLLVESTNGSVVQLFGHIDGLMTKNIRASKMSSDSLGIHGLTLETLSKGIESSWTTGLCVVTGARGALLRDLKVRSSPTAAFNMRSCFGYRIENLDLRFANEDPGNGAFGYGIVDVSGSHGTISNFFASHVRHAYTDSIQDILANTADANAYGQTRHIRIMDSACIGASVSAFDTHHGSREVTFLDCHAHDSAAGFSLRGIKHQVIGSTAHNCRIGIHVFTESGGESWGHVIRDFTAEGASTSGLRFHVNQTGHPRAGEIETRPSFVYQTRLLDAGNDSIYVNNTTLRIVNVTIQTASAIPSSARLIHQNNSNLYIRDSEVSLPSDCIATNLDVWTIQGDESTIAEADSIGFNFSELQKDQIRHFAVAAGVVNIKMRELRLSYPLKRVSNTLPIGSYINWESYKHSGSSSFIVADKWEISEEGAALNIRQSRDPVIRVVSDTAGPNRTMVALPRPIKVGQQLIVSNYGSVGRITIPSTDTSLASSIDLIIIPNSERKLVALQDSRWHTFDGD